MARTLCIANQKGGVGKTTTAVNLANGLAQAGQRTLLMDLDPQCNASSNMQVEVLARHPLVTEQILESLVTQRGDSELFVIPGCRKLDDLGLLMEMEESELTCLSERLSGLQEEFDFILIDCPPSLGWLTESALTAANEVVMPLQCEYFAMEGLTQMIDVIKRVMKRGPNQLQFGGILLTMYEERLELTHEVEQEVREFFGEVVFDSVIVRDVAIAEAPSHGQSVIEYSPRARGARAYVELCMEVLERD